MDMIIRLCFFALMGGCYLYVQVCLIISRKWKEEETYPVMDMHNENIWGFTGDLLDSMLHVNSEKQLHQPLPLKTAGYAIFGPLVQRQEWKAPKKFEASTKSYSYIQWPSLGVSLLHPSLISHGDSAAVLLGIVPVIVSTMPNLVRYRDSQICRAEWNGHCSIFREFESKVLEEQKQIDLVHMEELFFSHLDLTQATAYALHWSWCVLACRWPQHVDWGELGN